jgi:hypothetical protein
LENNIKLQTSSPHYPRGNGFAEKSVSIAKNIMRKCSISNLDLGLLDYRNTPIPDLNLSPAERLMCRKLRDKMPVTNLDHKLYDKYEVLRKG